MATAKSSFCYPSLNISSSDVGETEKRVTFNDSPTPSINGSFTQVVITTNKFV